MSHIDGATHISVSDIGDKIQELDKNKFYLVYCQSGNRSNSAANTLRNSGFKNVSNMTGGIGSWGGNGYPTTSSCEIM
jgi:rhodanese-related sulfurtransferase